LKKAIEKKEEELKRALEEKARERNWLQWKQLDEYYKQQ